jgi:hypothetical protein
MALGLLASKCGEQRGMGDRPTGLSINILRVRNSAGVSLHLQGGVANCRHLRVLIGQLRKKLGDNSASPAYVLTDG